MENPEETLIELLETNWDTVLAGGNDNIDAADIVFSQSDYRIDRELKGRPNVFAQFIPGNALKREQDTDTLHYSYLGVGMVYWCKGKTVAEIKAERAIWWAMIENAYKLLNSSSYKPSGWVHMITKNLAIYISDVVPPVLEAAWLVEAKFDWSVS